MCTSGASRARGGGVAVAAKSKLVKGGAKLVVVWAGLAFVLLASSALAARGDAAGMLELVESLHGQSGETMVLGGHMVGLMDGHCCVNDLWLDGLLLNNRHNSLMHVMVYSLAADSRGSFLGVPGLMGGGGMLKSAELGSYSGLGVLVVLMSEFLVLDWDHVMLVLLGQRLLV